MNICCTLQAKGAEVKRSSEPVVSQVFLRRMVSCGAILFLHSKGLCGQPSAASIHPFSASLSSPFISFLVRNT